jgi:hypothetical protein
METPEIWKLRLVFIILIYMMYIGSLRLAINHQMAHPYVYHVTFVSRTNGPYIICLDFNVVSPFSLPLQDMHYSFMDISRVL